MDGLKELFKAWMPGGKVTAMALGAAFAVILLIVFDPAWDQEWKYMATVVAAGIIAGYWMPEQLPWNKKDDTDSA